MSTAICSCKGLCAHSVLPCNGAVYNGESVMFHGDLCPCEVLIGGMKSLLLCEELTTRKVHAYALMDKDRPL
eukprot:444254-Pelagomonas_calceolata.AAC.1